MCLLVNPPSFLWNCCLCTAKLPKSIPDYATTTWLDPKPFSPLSTAQLSTGSVWTPSLWSRSKLSWDLATWSWERLNTGKVNAPGTSGLHCCSWLSAPLWSTVRHTVTEAGIGQGSSPAAASITRVIWDRRSLYLPINHEKSYPYLGENLVL